MSHKQWTDAVRPKVEGTRNLHEKFGANLDFFVMLSSALGVLGSRTQSNKAAGSTFQDAFARYRTSLGLPAVTIDLGMIKSPDSNVDDGGEADRLAEQSGFRPLQEEEIIRIMEAAVRAPFRNAGAETERHTQIITGLAPFETSEGVIWREERRFANLTRLQTSSLGAKTGKKGRKNGGDISVALTKSETFEEATGAVADAIVEKLSDMFMMAPEEIDKGEQLGRYGVDSLVAVELRNWFVGKMLAEVSIFDILQSTSLLSLAEKAAGRSEFVVKAGLV